MRFRALAWLFVAIIVLGVVTFAAVLFRSGYEQAHGITAHPVDLSCEIARGREKAGTLAVAVLVTNPSEQDVDRIDVNIYTEPKGAGNRLTFKHLDAHSSQRRVQEIFTGLSPGIHVKGISCEDRSVLYRDGTRWDSPYTGPYLP